MKPDRVLAMLSMAAKAGKLASGSFSAEKAIKSGKAYLVIIAVNASDNTKKKFRNACAYRDVPCFEYSLSGELGGSIGKEDRMVLAVTDEGLAGCVKQRIEEA